MERREFRVLLVEDNPGDARLIREYMSGGTKEVFRIDHCEDLACAQTHLARTNADVVLLDLGLPDSQGLDTLRSIRKQAPRLPIVVLTGLRDEEMGVDASGEGAQDYLTKDTLTPELLATTLRYAIARQTVQDELRGERDFREAVLQTAQVTVLILDSAGRIVQFNRHFEELSGVSLEEARGRDWFETFLPKEEQARIRTLFTGALAGQQTRGSVNPIVIRSGEYRWLEWYDKTLTHDSGEVTLVCIGVDVTEKRRMLRQQALVAETLVILNRPNEWKNLIIDILEASGWSKRGTSRTLPFAASRPSSQPSRGASSTATQRAVRGATLRERRNSPACVET
jgi:PAS domain S-box-containing protein